jgi:hypothetical protein
MYETSLFLFFHIFLKGDIVKKREENYYITIVAVYYGDKAEIHAYNRCLKVHELGGWRPWSIGLIMERASTGLLIPNLRISVASVFSPKLAWSNRTLLTDGERRNSWPS